MYMGARLWLMETRPHFLLLSAVLVFLGSSVAAYHGFFNPFHFLLALAGLLLAHASVNVLNDYWDYKTGIDLMAERTPFSGGSGLLPAGILRPASVYRFGIGCLLLAVPIAVYFAVVKGLLLVPILVVGALFIYFYTTHFARWLAGELCAGLGLGALPVLGAYFVQTGFYSWTAVAASVPALILTHNLLFLNEFPDMEPDRKGRRRNLILSLGRLVAGRLYVALTLGMYLWIVGGTVTGFMPLPALLGLLTVPWAGKAVREAWKGLSEKEKVVPALAANVLVVLGTQALLGVGYLIAVFL